MNKKIIFYMNECPYEKNYCPDLKIIRSHEETEIAIKESYDGESIRTFSLADIDLKLTKKGFDIYLAKWYKIRKHMKMEYKENPDDPNCKSELYDKTYYSSKLRFLKIYEHMPSIDKDLCVNHNLFKLIVGGTFENALKHSNDKVEF